MRAAQTTWSHWPPGRSSFGVLRVYPVTSLSPHRARVFRGCGGLGSRNIALATSPPGASRKGRVCATRLTHESIACFPVTPPFSRTPYPGLRDLRESGLSSGKVGGNGPRWRRTRHVFGFTDVATALRHPWYSSRQPFATRPPAASEPEGLSEQQREAQAYLWRARAAPNIPTSNPPDPPDRTRQRHIESAAFTPRVVCQMLGSIAICASDLRDVASARGDGLDVVRDLAYPLPAIIVAALLGLPVKDWSRVKVLSEGPLPSFPSSVTLLSSTNSTRTGEPSLLNAASRLSCEIVCDRGQWGRSKPPTTYLMPRRNRFRTPRAWVAHAPH